jgi:peptide/nickel transport system permease protein
MTADGVLAPTRRGPIGALRWLGAAAARDPQLTVSLAIIIGCIIAVAGARFIASASPIAQHMADRLQGPSLTHPFGTDQLGRDVFVRVLYGGQASLPAAFAVVLTGASLGTLIGAVAGYAGRVVDEIVMRFTDMVLAFPILVLAMALAAALGASLIHGVIALIAVWWPQYARVCRGAVLDLRERDYTVAAKAAGRSPFGILFRVIMPNALPPLMVMAAVDVGRAILNFSILSFLGLGGKPPAPEWGSMVSSGAEVMDQWWVATFPGLAILLIVFGFNLLGDSMRDALDPWISYRRS